MPICTFVVENPDNTAVRLDAYAASVLPDNISRSRLKAGLKKLTVNGKNPNYQQKLNTTIL